MTTSRVLSLRSLSFLASASVLAFLTAAPLESQGKDRQYEPSSFVWKPELSPKGPVTVAVCLKNQTAAVYRNGIKIGECEVSTGKKGHETPTGVFHILNKDADHHSATYNNASMPFSQRLTWDGVALHAGGLPGYPSSHGCVHLPYEFSRKLFGITHNGTTVVITNDDPGVHVSQDHHLGFQAGASSDFIWKPEASPSGPVSLLFSRKDQKLFVLRNGILIGEGAAKTGLFSKHTKGTSAYIFAGWKKAGRGVESRWVKIGGHKNDHSVSTKGWFKLDPRFQHALQALLVPGTNLVLTSNSVSKESSTDHGFRVLAGPEVEKADQKK